MPKYRYRCIECDGQNVDFIKINIDNYVDKYNKAPFLDIYLNKIFSFCSIVHCSSVMLNL